MTQSDANSSMVILCVDDEQNILKALRRLLADEPYEILLASSGAEALSLMAQQSVDLIVSDMKMPQMTGAELLEQVAIHFPQTYRIILTGYADMASTIAAVNKGKIHRYLQKPWNNEELISSIHDGLEKIQLQRDNAKLQADLNKRNAELQHLNHHLEERVLMRTSQLRKVLLQLNETNLQIENEHQSLLKVLYNLISINPHLSGGFAQSVSLLCSSIARRLNLSATEIDRCALAGQLCEIGLLGMPIDLYDKPYHRLDYHDKDRYLTHPKQAQLILSPATHLHPVADIIAHQYERMNGSGLPDKMIGEQIPVGSRILAVARDFWGHMQQKISKEPMSPPQVVRFMQMQQGSVYDPLVLQQLEAIVQRGQPTEMEDKIDHGISTADLKVGMKLQSNLYNHAKILLLPEGHVFTDATIQKIRAFERTQPKPLRLHIVAEDQGQE